MAGIDHDTHGQDDDKVDDKDDEKDDDKVDDKDYDKERENICFHWVNLEVFRTTVLFLPSV